RLAKDSTWLVRAEASAREAMALDSTRLEPHRVLAGVLSAQRRNAEALEEYERVTAMDSTDLDAYYSMVRAHARLHRTDRERALILAAVARRPDTWQPRHWLASWEYRNGDVDAA